MDPYKGIWTVVVVTGMLLTWISGCSGIRAKHSLPETAKTGIQVSSGYRIEKTGEGYILTVTNPWQGAQKDTFSYTLYRNKNNKEVPLNYTNHIRIPVRRVICTSTTHIAFLRALGKTGNIAGIPGGSLICDSTVRAKLKEGLIADVGYDRQLDYERIMSLKPDLIFLYGIDKQVSGTIKRLEDMGISVIMVSDYLESTLMARLDWIRFFAAFFDDLSRGEQYYDSVLQKYSNVQKMVPPGNKPTVMTGLPWNEVWFIPGRESLPATMISEAGGQYLFSSLDTPEAVPMDIEQVYLTAKDADIWINAGTALTLNDISGLDPRLDMFRPVNTGRVYNNNNRLNRQGGNDYWESGVIHPDRILKDLVSIFHPEVLNGHRLYYYRHLQ